MKLRVDLSYKQHLIFFHTYIDFSILLESRPYSIVENKYDRISDFPDRQNKIRFQSDMIDI